MNCGRTILICLWVYSYFGNTHMETTHLKKGLPLPHTASSTIWGSSAHRFLTIVIIVWHRWRQEGIFSSIDVHSMCKGGRLDATRVGYTLPKAQLFMKLNIFDGDTEMIHIFETHCTIHAIWDMRHRYLDLCSRTRQSRRRTANNRRTVHPLDFEIIIVRVFLWADAVRHYLE